MINVRLINKSGKVVKQFHSVHEAYSYAKHSHIEEFSVQTTLS